MAAADLGVYGATGFEPLVVVVAVQRLAILLNGAIERLRNVPGGIEFHWRSDVRPLAPSRAARWP